MVFIVGSIDTFALSVNSNIKAKYKFYYKSLVKNIWVETCNFFEMKAKPMQIQHLIYQMIKKSNFAVPSSQIIPLIVLFQYVEYQSHDKFCTNT
jgi:hypothetical protein